jgi:glycosyltransferase involved in cell wall biosynthesis
MTQRGAGSRAVGRERAIHVLVVAHGPPMRGGVATVAMDLVEDPGLGAEFDVEFLNTAQNDEARGRFALANLKRVAHDAIETFRRSRPGTVVHTHSVQYPGLVAWRQVAIALAARLRGAAVLGHNHAQPPYMEGPGEWEISRLNRWGFRVLDRLVEANVLIAAAGVPNLRRYMPTAPLPVVHNSIVVDDVVRSSAVHDPPVVLFIGELLERKGLVELLDAVDLLAERGVTDFELRIVGDDRPGLDPLKDEMVALVKSRGYGASLTGPLDRAEVLRHLSEADLYVFPTFTEGQPFTVIEALASGVPIVATEIQAITNMIEDPTHGRLVPVRDAVAVADAMQELLADPDERRRISDACRERARERFDRSVFRARMAALYRAAGNARGRRAKLRAGRARVAAIDRA